MALNFPVFGDVVEKVAIARFARTLGTLINSGVPILQALNIVKDTSGNVVISRAIQDTHDSVKEGETITKNGRRDVSSNPKGALASWQKP